VKSNAAIAGGELVASLLTDADRTDLSAIAGANVAFDEPLAPHTSWKVGGPADAYIVLESTAQLSDVLRFCVRRRTPWFVLGSGSNLLVGDGGVRGLVLRLGGEFAALNFADDVENEVVVHAGASASLALLTAQAASRGAVGVGSLAGIPGSVGGALRMNAGTDRETGEFVREVTVQTPARPDPHPVSLQYYYRHTSLASDAVVARVTFAFERGDAKQIRGEVQARLVRRKATQPLQYPNAGSCFRNPPGDRAGRLIEAAGLKGKRRGGAEISELHANFIVNTGTATAQDVAALLDLARTTVRERFGIELELEVRLIGVFTANA
jgi:UDP-N-acetylmuramate dehydrogenase